MEVIVDNLKISDEREEWRVAAEHFKKPVFHRSELEMSRILTLVSRLALLKPLSFETRLALAKSFLYVTLHTNEVVLSPEQVSADPYTGGCYIVLFGCVDLVLQTPLGRSISELHAGDHFGTYLSIGALPAGSYYSAKENSCLLHLPVEPYQRLLESLEGDEMLQRIEYFTKLQVPIFATWGQTELEVLAQNVYIRKFQSREMIVREKEIGNCMYFILAGKCKVVREIVFNQPGAAPLVKLLELAVLSPGEYFGELGMFQLNVDENRKRPQKGKAAAGGVKNLQDFFKFDDFDTIDKLQQAEDEDGSELEVHLTGARQASVFSHTPCELFVLDYDKLKTVFPPAVMENVLVRMRGYADGYPTQAEIRSHFTKQQKWFGFKSTTMDNVHRESARFA